MNLIFHDLGDSKVEEYQKSFIFAFVDQDIRNEVFRLGGQVFHRAQFLFLMREAIEHCADRPIEEFQGYLSSGIGELCLMANDHVHRSLYMQGQAAAPDDLLTLIADFIPIMEAHEFRNPMLRIARIHKMIRDLAPIYRDSNVFFDIPALFENATSVPLQTFEALMVGLLAHMVELTKSLLQEQAPKGIPISAFDSYGLSPSARDAFFSLISASCDEFREKHTKSHIGLPYDYTIIRDRPYLAMSGYVTPLDLSMALEKFESTIFWRAIRSLGNKEGNNLIAFWGRLFEDYIVWLLTESLDGRHNVLVSDPRYIDNHDQVSDAIVLCGSTAIFIECKGNVVSGNSKYSGDPKKLGEEIEAKFIEPQGIRQLVSGIKNVFARPARRVDGVTLDHIGCVIPLLITWDDLGDSICVNAYLNRRFSEIAKEEALISSLGASVRCLPLQSVCADTIEKISPHLKHTRLAFILSERLRADPTLRANFFNYPISGLRPENSTDIPLLRGLLMEISQLVPKVLNLSPDGKASGSGPS